MALVVGVSLKPTRKVYNFAAGNLELLRGDQVVVNTAKGKEFGEVVSPPQEVPEEELVAPLKSVVRKATQDDFERISKNKSKESEAFDICLKKIRASGLPMKLVDVEYTFEGNKVVCYFSSEDRIDFRELVKDLASSLKGRIEMRQIGVRDEAKFIGGLGPCGLNLCCSQFLSEFAPVSIRMAKEQDLPLNPGKISGSCGRLMCCLKYEHDAYLDFKGRAPRRGETVQTPAGAGKVVEHNVPGERVVVELEGGLRRPFGLVELNREERPPSRSRRRRG